MAAMSVTRDVSKLTGWLKAVAACRVEGHAIRGEVYGPEGTGARAWGSGGRKRPARGGPATEGLGGHGTRGRAHAEHLAHVRDAGRVEAHWLVEGLRVLPSRKQGLRLGSRCAGRNAGARLGRVGQWREQVAFTWRTRD